MKSVILSASIAAALAGPAAAQDWQFYASIYGWAPDSVVELVTPRGTVTGELSFSDALDKLDFAFMGAFEAQNDRLSLVLDTIFLSLSDEEALPGFPGFSAADLTSDINITSAYALWAVSRTPQGRLDLGGGLRFYDADNRVGLVGGPRPVGLSLSDSWVDPVIALRYRTEFATSWFGAVFADIGGSGGGSELTWQLVGTVGYAFSDSLTLEGGYRILRADRPTAVGNLDIEMSGPIIGVRWQF